MLGNEKSRLEPIQIAYWICRKKMGIVKDLIKQGVVWLGETAE